MIDATQGAMARTSQPKASEKLEQQYQQFLTLLTAQISNQDPLKPMDSGQFVTQLAQLSQVEQGVVTNKNLEAMLSQLSEISTRSDMQMIGRDVLVPSDRARLDEGGFAGAYELGGVAKDTTVRIVADDGHLIRTLKLPGLGPAQTHAIKWDGRDNVGLPVPAGTFRFEVEAVDADGAALPVTTLSRNHVEGISLTGMGPELHLSTGARIASGAVREVF